MTSELLYGGTTFSRPYFNMQKFEDRIYNRVGEREKRINARRKYRVLDKLIVVFIFFLLTAFIVLGLGITYKNVMISSKDRYIKKLEKTLEIRLYERKNFVSSLKTDMKFDDIKMKAYMELNMITPTEKNTIRFDKSDNGFVRQYENIR